MDNSSVFSPPPVSSPFSNTSPLGFSSPYLNLDPKALNAYSSSDYIYPDGRTRPTRGRFEYAFGTIGGSVMTGAALGGIVGGYNGLKLTSDLKPGLVKEAINSATATTQQPLSWAVRRSQILNYILKTGARTANTFGLVALIYSALDAGLSYYQDNDELNSVAAGTMTGLMYRGLSNPESKADSAASKLMTGSRFNVRLRRGAVGALLGFSLSSLFVLATNREKFFRK